MNTSLETKPAMPVSLQAEGGPLPVWRTPAALALLLVLALLGLYWETVWSMVSIWSRSETFTHGFLIAPISAFLIWQRRKALARLDPAPDYRGLPVLALLGVLWLLAHYASVLVIEQGAMVAMIPVLLWTLLGWQVVWAMLFPLAFLFFAVPVGEELILPLMDFTADFTVAALQLTGIPVYREGTFFEIPSGHWSVVEGCSGVRYLIASVTLGCLYAYLTYRSALRRTVFVLFAIVVPIIANGMRAYMIVMIAHLSDMRLALGVDHFIYGWVWFGLVMLLLFWLGSFWREDHIQSEPAVVTAPSALHTVKSPWPVSGAVLILLVLWPALAYVHATSRAGPVNVTLAVPAVADHWQTTDSKTEWRPDYLTADAELQHYYRQGEHWAGVYLGYYRHQRQGAELITSTNVLIKQKDPVWRQVADAPRHITVHGKSIEVRQAKLRSADQDLLVWYWYWIDGVYTTNHYLAKLWEAKAKFLGETGDAAVMMVFTDMPAGQENAEALLARFVDDMEPAIRTSLENTADE